MAISTNFKLAKKLGLFIIPIILIYYFHSDLWSIISYEDTNSSDNFFSDNPIMAESKRSALDVDQIEDNTLKKITTSTEVIKYYQFLLK